jgi:hypothetical protein
MFGNYFGYFLGPYTDEILITMAAILGIMILRAMSKGAKAGLFFMVLGAAALAGVAGWAHHAIVYGFG